MHLQNLNERTTRMFLPEKGLQIKLVCQRHVFRFVFQFCSIIFRFLGTFFRNSTYRFLSIYQQYILDLVIRSNLNIITFTFN